MAENPQTPDSIITPTTTGIPDLTRIFISLNEVFPLFGALVILLIALFGMYAGLRGMIELYEVATNEGRMSVRNATTSGGLGKIVVGALMIIMPILFVRAANTFVLGGSESFSMFNYVVSGGNNYCEDFKTSITYFFMALGLVAWFFMFSILYGRTNGSTTTTGNPWFYGIGGILCFFINDVATILSNTTGFTIGLENLCGVLGTAGGS